MKEQISKLKLTAEYIRREYNDGLCFRYDVLSRKIQISLSPSLPLGRELDTPHSGGVGGGLFRPLTDRDINTIACDCATVTGANITDREVRTVLGSDLVPDVHPLREYLDSVRDKWDGTCSYDFIEILADHVTVKGDQPTWRAYFKKWFCAMVASWLYDEVVNHQVLVLIGRQGTGKTTWLEHLLPPHLRDYGCKQASVRELSKDDRIRIAEFGLINMDEIDSCTPRELNVLKSVITSADVNERAAYGHTKERRIRCASFCASGNNRNFLSDDTGNRRWLPFEVESILDPFTAVINYDTVYAQAVYLVEHGYNYWFCLDEIEDLEQHNEEYRAVRNEEELLPVYFKPCLATDNNAKFMTASEIHAKLKIWGNIDNPLPLNKFGEVLKRGGFIRKKIHGGKNGFLVQEIDYQATRNAMELDEIRKGESGECTF